VRVARPSAIGDWDAWKTDGPHLSDSIIFDDDIHGPLRWGTRTVYDRNSPEDETVEGPLAFIGTTGGSGLYLSPSLRGHYQYCQNA
ncbi:uncharacterized protein METZ01_LOCUS179323, partial [marine metagenome]